MKKLFCLCVGTLLLCGCPKKKAEDVKQAIKDPELQGKNFVSTCLQKPFEGLFTLGNAVAQQVTYRVDGSKITRTARTYAKPDCTGDAAYSFEETGKVDINKGVGDSTVGYVIEMDFDKLKVNVVSDEGAKAANAWNLCGVANWTPKQEKEVTAEAESKTCYNAAVPRHVSNRYRVDNNTLYLGTTTTGTVAQKDRPEKVDMSVPFKAQ